MGKLTAKQVQALAKGETKKHSDDGGLYLWVRNPYAPSWRLRYSSNGKRREMTLGSYPDVSLADARAEAELRKKELRTGIDPLLTRQRKKQQTIITVDHLFNDWYETDLAKRLKYPNIPKRIFTKEISPSIGSMKIEEVNARDIRSILHEVTASNRPTIANDTLMYLKQLFRHAIKLDLTANNPASAFNVNDAGGVEKSKDRALSIDELSKAFRVFRENSDSFTRDNYLACGLLVCLGVRKGELCGAKWEEFNFNKAIWELPSGRSKTGAPISIPLPSLAINWLNELKGRSFDSDYVFPNRRTSKNPHMGSDTLNRAITKLFGHEAGRKRQPPNKMGTMKHFTIHDLRRTFRSIAASVGIDGHIAERCLNHKLKGVEGIYDRHDYLEERRDALNKIATLIQPIIDNMSNVKPFNRKVI